MILFNCLHSGKLGIIEICNLFLVLNQVLKLSLLVVVIAISIIINKNFTMNVLVGHILSNSFWLLCLNNNWNLYDDEKNQYTALIHKCYIRNHNIMFRKTLIILWKKSSIGEETKSLYLPWSLLFLS